MDGLLGPVRSSHITILALECQTTAETCTRPCKDDTSKLPIPNLPGRYCRIDPFDAERTFEHTFAKCANSKAEPMPCIFPFIYKGTTYDSCTNALLGEIPEYEDKTEEDFFWCAIAVEKSGLMPDKMWGRCNLSYCSKSKNPITTSSKCLLCCKFFFAQNCTYG